MRKKKKIITSILTLIIIIVYTLYNTTNTNNTNNNNYQKKEVPVTSNESLKIYFIDVGQADSILITNKSKNMLIDAGNNEDGEKLVNYLKSLEINKFDYVIGTHAHEDHIGGMDDIINNFNIDRFYMPNAMTTTKTFEDVLDALYANSITLEIPTVDSSIAFGDGEVKVLYTGKDKSDLNDTSVVLKLNYFNNNFLLMGDATSDVEKEILSKDLESDVLKVGHHGSSYSTTTSFLNEVNPKYAVISVGLNNTYNHPRETTLNKLEKIGAKIYRTDIDGTILMESDGTNINVDTFKTDTNG